MPKAPRPKPTAALNRSLRVRRFLVLGVLAFGGCRARHTPSPVAHAPMTPVQSKIVSGARDQLTWGTGYDPAYYRITYPNGDVPRKVGVCTDVVIRAYRQAGYDLQRMVHEDIASKRDAYPNVREPDTNIDHRRVPNVMTFFLRHGKKLGVDLAKTDDWKPADVVWFKTFTGRDHIGVLTDRLDDDGLPFVLHNVGNGPQEEDLLRAIGWRIKAHTRYPG